MPQLYLALDKRDAEENYAIALSTAKYVDGFKIGMGFFFSQGAAGYERIAQLNKPIFLDLKLCDIPNTVALGFRSLLSALSPAPHLLTVHTLGGYAMMAQAVQTVKELSPSSMVVAVTLLTSLQEEDLDDMGFADHSIVDQVVNLAEIASRAECDGVVSSLSEVPTIKKYFPHLKCVTPGIRLLSDRPAKESDPFASDDQKRVMSPEEAAAYGCDIVVVGRPILEANNPSLMAQTFKELLNHGIQS